MWCELMCGKWESTTMSPLLGAWCCSGARRVFFSTRGAGEQGSEQQQQQHRHCTAPRQRGAIRAHFAGKAPHTRRACPHTQTIYDDLRHANHYERTASSSGRIVISGMAQLLYSTLVDESVQQTRAGALALTLSCSACHATTSRHHRRWSEGESFRAADDCWAAEAAERRNRMRCGEMEVKM